MNQRNVDALTAILKEPIDLSDGPPGRPVLDAKKASFIARWLAYRGVLVPSALTDDECRKAGGAMMDGYECEFTEDGAIEMRAELERIAKGEIEGGEHGNR